MLLRLILTSLQTSLIKFFAQSSHIAGTVTIQEISSSVMAVLQSPFSRALMSACDSSFKCRIK